MSATMSIMGLYSYDPTIFDYFSVPSGIDKDVVVSKICIDCMELEILYPDAPFLKRAIGVWSSVNLPIWTKLLNSENFNYNPIWNVDADIVEDGTAYKNRAGNNTDSGTGSRTESGTDFRNKAGNNVEDSQHAVNKAGNNTETGTDDATVTQSVKGFNSNTWAEHEKSVTDDDTSKTGSFAEGETGTDKKTGTFAEGETGGDNRTVSDSDSRTGSFAEGETGGDSRHTRRTGNIGVTTTQQMIQQEREVDDFSTIKFIVNDFKKQFCLLVY